MYKKRFVKVIKGKVVSSLWLYMVELPSRRLAVIEEVETMLEHRENGYATELIKQVLKFAEEVLYADCVELTVREDKPKIQEFYKKLGFYDRKNRAYRYAIDSKYEHRKI